MRFIMVGTRYTTSARYRSRAARVASASNRGSTTTWVPCSSAAHAHTTGPLWNSGPGMTRQPSGLKPSTDPTAGSITPASPETMSLGRPVDPPEVGAFHAGLTTSGSSIGPSRSGGR